MTCRWSKKTSTPARPIFWWMPSQRRRVTSTSSAVRGPRASNGSCSNRSSSRPHHPCRNCGICRAAHRTREVVTAGRLSPASPYRDQIVRAADMASPPAAPYAHTYAFRLPDGDWVELPLVPLPPDETTACQSLHHRELLRPGRPTQHSHGGARPRLAARRYRRNADSGTGAGCIGRQKARTPLLRTLELFAQVLVRRRFVCVGELHYIARTRENRLPRSTAPRSSRGQTRGGCR